MVKCKSGLQGWRNRLRDAYSDFEDFAQYDAMYGLAARLGYSSAEEAWAANNMVEGSAEPSDFRISSKKGRRLRRQATRCAAFLDSLAAVAEADNASWWLLGVQVRLSTRDNWILLDSLFDDNRNGNAPKVLAKLCELADEYQVPLKGHVHPFGLGARLTEAQLLRWYALYGFRKVRQVEMPVGIGDDERVTVWWIERKPKRK